MFNFFKKSSLILGIVLSLCATSVFADELFVFMRHGEKPEGGLGQLNCQGLNRSMALPEVLLSKYGKPDFIFAPNPAAYKADKGTMYAYIRPLATIEPTAIEVGKPVNVKYDYQQVALMVKELNQKQYDNKTVFIAWEHYYLQKMVTEFVAKIDPAEATKVPKWESTDFDSLYVVRVFNVGTKKFVTFEIEKQDLNKLSEKCSNSQ